MAKMNVDERGTGAETGAAAGAQAHRVAQLPAIINGLRANATLVAAIAFAAALLVFLVFHFIEIPKTRFWTDELFSFWAGDPDLTFGEALFQRILRDSNGPIYFSLVHFAQQAGLEGRTAFLVINMPVLAAMLGLMLWRGWRHGALSEALWCAALFLVCTPVLAYASEGRVYGMTMAVAAAMAFIAGLRVTLPQPDRSAERVDMIVYGVLGFLAAWMHLYGALFAGALGAGLVVAGWFMGRRWDLVRLGLSLGGAATVGFGLWLAIAYPMFSKTASEGFWLPFNLTTLIDAAWMLKTYTVGFTPVLVVAAAFIGLSLMTARSRPAALLVIVTAVLFVGIPLAASLHTVIFAGRYVLAGAPAILILIVFLLRAQLPVLLDAGAAVWRRALAGAGVLVLASAALTGTSTASWHFANRWDWRGLDIITPLIAQCPEGEVRVLNSSITNLSGFDYLLDGALGYLDAGAAPVRDVADIACPVLGWGEHVIDTDLDRDWWEKVDVAGVLEDFHLTNTSGVSLEIRRHVGGLVLLRADAVPEQ